MRFLRARTAAAAAADARAATTPTPASPVFGAEELLFDAVVVVGFAVVCV
jgi:hypothetical protein